VEYENNALIVKVDTDDEYEFARDMQVQPLTIILPWIKICSSFNTINIF